MNQGILDPVMKAAIILATITLLGCNPHEHYGHIEEAKIIVHVEFGSFTHMSRNFYCSSYRGDGTIQNNNDYAIHIIVHRRTPRLGFSVIHHVIDIEANTTYYGEISACDIYSVSVEGVIINVLALPVIERHPGGGDLIYMGWK